MYSTSRINQSGGGGKTPRRVMLSRRSQLGQSILDTSGYISPYTLNTSRKRSLNFSMTHNQSFNQSFQNSILAAENENFVIESFGGSMPVLVTEALTLADRNVEVSAKLSETGWAWLVCNRRLFIWKYKLSPGARSAVGFCKELTLPPSDLAHKAELVCIFVSKESQTPSAVAVSPEGIVRYWSSIAHEVTSQETTVDLQGQECFSLTNIQPLGCILATTTSSLVHIIPTIIDGQHTVVIETLKVPHGMLAGIGRRVSSFIFGAVPNQSESKQLSRVLAEDGSEEDEKNVYVLSGHSLQKWILIADEPEKMICEVDLDRSIKDEILQTFNCQGTVHFNQIKNWLIDMQFSDDKLMLLIACVHPQDDMQMCYMFVYLDKNNPARIMSSSLIRFSESWADSNEEQLLGFKCVVPDVKSLVAYFYNNSKIICVHVNKNCEVDTLEFVQYGDKLLGSGACDQLPLFFSTINGILSVVNITADTSFLPSQSLLETSHDDKLEELSMSEDKTSRLRAAFLYFCRKEFGKAKTIVEEDFLSSSSHPRADSYLDQAVATFSQDMINDFPASDPRWAETLSESGNISSSLHILQQLSDKFRVHELLLKFLKEIGLWQRLYQVTVRGTPMTTCLLLCEHAEKLKAAMALRSLQVEQNILEEAIQLVLQTRDAKVPSKLTAQDVFYREVSNIDDIYLALYDLEQDKTTELSQDELANFVSSVNTIFLESLQPIFDFRQRNTHLFENENSSKAEYIPWTSADGDSGLRTTLKNQYVVTADHLDTNTEHFSPNLIHQQLLDLADMILDGYRCQLESVSEDVQRYDVLNQKYIEDRSKLIMPLFEADQLERATSLAEKYCDFGVLVKICDKTNNQERIERYMNQFAEQGFSDFVFKWYLDEGKRGKLLSQPATQHGKLARFLDNHKSLSWLHYFNTQQFGIAQKQLRNMAVEEERYMARKKSMLSLSKLALLASDEPQTVKNKEIEAITMEQNLLLYQEMLPARVLGNLGVDLDSMRVMKPEELIELYISEENMESNEYDFKKALDLLEYVKDDGECVDVERLRAHVWCQAVLKNNWAELDTNNPLESVRNTLFFRLVDLAFTQGVNMDSFLIPVDMLVESEELEDLAKDSNFLFLIKAGYEQVMHLIA